MLRSLDPETKRQKAEALLENDNFLYDNGVSSFSSAQLPHRSSPLIKAGRTESDLKYSHRSIHQLTHRNYSAEIDEDVHPDGLKKTTFSQHFGIPELALEFPRLGGATSSSQVCIYAFL